MASLLGKLDLFLQLLVEERGADFEESGFVDLTQLRGLSADD